LSGNLSGTARLTVEDAARLLGIQNASVRKRIKRGTLASEEHAQGRTFVFLELDELVQDGSKSRSSPTERPSMLSLENLGAISAAVAVLTAGVYVLGLVALWAPISRTYTHDFGTAWYAASQVPRTMVAWYGLKPVWFPVLTSLFSMVFVIIQNYRAWIPRSNLPAYKSFAARILHVTLVIIWVVGIGVLAIACLAYLSRLRPAFLSFVAHFWVLDIPTSSGWYLAIAFASFLFITSLPTGLLYGNFRLFRATQNAFDCDGREVLPSITKWRPFLRSFGIYFVLLFVAAFMWAMFVAKPSLPMVTVTINDEKITERGDTEFSARLLAHTDAFWYVFDEEGGSS
jgi:hypothetical protein